MKVPKERTAVPLNKGESPKSWYLLGDSCHLRLTKPFGLFAALCTVSIQPLADVVTNYTCQYGNAKGEKLFH